VTASPGQRVAAILPLPFPEHVAAALEPLAGQSPLVRVVRDAVAAVVDPAKVIVAVAERFAGDVSEHLAREGLGAVGVAVVGGPATREQCLAAALERVGIAPVSARFVLVYDVRQPLTSAEVRNRLIEGLAGGAPVVLPVLAVTDSVKAVDDHGAVIASLDRSALQTVQYPRGFAADHLAQLLTESAGEFDEALAAIRAAVPVTTVDGDAEAVAVDLQHDAPYLEAVIASRRPRAGSPGDVRRSRSRARRSP
jgi:2-C-methyl-D-erythritol 4-phosphate cytidylyltransferase